MSIEEQVQCVKRELAMRRRVYPRLVYSERMIQSEADHEILAMQAVLETLKKGIAEPKLPL